MEAFVQGCVSISSVFAYLDLIFLLPSEVRSDNLRFLLIQKVRINVYDAL